MFVAGKDHVNESDRWKKTTSKSKKKIMFYSEREKMKGSRILNNENSLSLNNQVISTLTREYILKL